jgi:hypothetical protein
MQKKYLLALGGIAVISAVLILALTQVRSVRSGPQASTPTPNGLNPVDPSLLPVMPTAIQPEVVDLAPDIPYEDKPSVVVQHPDGSRTMYLVAPDQLDAFIQNLPLGDKFVGDIPPPSLMGHEPPTVTPEP